MTIITAADLVQKAGEILDRVMPAERSITAAQALADLETRLTPSQAAAWLRYSREAPGRGRGSELR